MSKIIKTKTFELAIYANGDPSSHKLALVLPGRLDTKDYPHMRSHVDFLSKNGYYALSFDPPGTWKSSGDVKSYTITNYLKSIHELIEHFGQKPTFLIGHSRGGSLAMFAATTNPIVTGFISVMSQASASKIGLKEAEAKGSIIEYRDLPDKPQQEREFNLPYSFFKDAMQYDALDNLSRYKKPKLFVYGSRDTSVTPELVRSAYERAAAPKQIVKLDSDHDYRKHPDLIEKVNQIIGKFIKQYETI